MIAVETSVTPCVSGPVSELKVTVDGDNVNVLPVPLLDGGQLAIITAEKIRGKPLPERVLEIIQWSGLILLLSFMLFVIVNDIRKL